MCKMSLSDKMHCRALSRMSGLTYLSKSFRKLWSSKRIRWGFIVRGVKVFSFVLKVLRLKAHLFEGLLSQISNIHHTHMTETGLFQFRPDRILNIPSSRKTSQVIQSFQEARVINVFARELTLFRARSHQCCFHFQPFFAF